MSPTPDSFPYRAPHAEKTGDWDHFSNPEITEVLPESHHARMTNYESESVGSRSETSRITLLLLLLSDPFR